MNERIKELADKARFVSTATPPTQDEILEKFAALVAKHEREECAQLCINEWDFTLAEKILARGEK